MGVERGFDISRKGHESWPGLFGELWMEIATKPGGIESAASEVHDLVDLCSPYMTVKELDFCDDQVSDYEGLRAQRRLCALVAKRKRAWDFEDDDIEELVVPVGRSHKPS